MIGLGVLTTREQQGRLDRLARHRIGLCRRAALTAALRLFRLTSVTKSLRRVVHPPGTGCRRTTQDVPDLGVHSMRLRLAVLFVARHRRRGARHRLGLGDHRPQRQRRLPEGGAERPGARQLHARAASAGTCSPGARSTRSHPTPGQQADRVQARLLGRLRHVQARRLEDVQERLPRVRRPRAAVVRRRLQGARRLVLGAPVLAADAARTTASRRPPKQSVWELRLSHWRGELPVADGQPELGLPASSTTSSARSRTSASRSTASSRRPPASRSTRSAATSTSTRSTRPTARAGSARTAS